MRDACNTPAGAAMGCEVCVGLGKGAQTVGTVRTMVSDLKCVCPLKSRGCVWEGSLGQVAVHLNGCGCLVVSCGYSVYGCATRLRRGDLPAHRGDYKEYHTELMSAFMTRKIEQLENANSVQGEAILDLQESVHSLWAEREYLRTNGVLWRITQRDSIIQMLQVSDKTMPARPVIQNANRTLIGPNFELDSFQLSPQLVVESADKVTLQLVSVAAAGLQQQQQQYLQQQYDCKMTPNYPYNQFARPVAENVAKKTKRKWPLGGKCKVILVNPTNRKADWLGEINTSKFTDNEPIKLTTIPSEVLLSEEHNNNGTIEIQLLFRTPYN